MTRFLFIIPLVLIASAAQAQQPGQVDRVLRVGLDPVTRWFLQLARRRDLAPDPHRGQRPVQTEPGRAGLIGHRHRAWQGLHPGPDVVIRRGQLGLDQLTRDAIDRRCRDRSAGFETSGRIPLIDLANRFRHAKQYEHE